jgi:hypothetical protein
LGGHNEQQRIIEEKKSQKEDKDVVFEERKNGAENQKMSLERSGEEARNRISNS